MYPDVKEGETVIIHHTIESQDYRSLKRIKGKHGNYVKEYRIINCLDQSAREIFGKLKFNKQFGKLSAPTVVPCGHNIFCEWGIDLFEKKYGQGQNESLEHDFTLESCKDIEDLRQTVNKLAGIANDRYKRKKDAMATEVSTLDEKKESDWERFRIVEAAAKNVSLEFKKTNDYLKKDHLVKCKVSAPDGLADEIVVPFKHLYPILIGKKKYIISHTRFIKGIIMEQFTPFRDQILVKPIEVENTSGLIMPDTVKEKPSTGTVMAVGDGGGKPMLVKQGDTILYKKNIGTPITIEGENYLVMVQNDGLGWYAAVKENKA
jgi:chaperonin GroES